MSKNKIRDRKTGGPDEQDRGRIPTDIQHREKKGARKRTHEALNGIRSLSDVDEDEWEDLEE